MALARIATQRVRAHQIVAQMQVDMRPGGKRGQRRTVGFGQRQQHDLTLKLAADNL